MPAASLYYYGASPVTPAIEAPLCKAFAGSLVHTRVRLADNFVNATTAPALTQWEGPYIRIYPLQKPLDRGNKQGLRAPSIIGKWARSEQYFVSPSAVAAGFVEPVKDAALAECNFDDEFYYEIDLLGSKPIYLPFDAELKLATQFAGAWLVDLVVTEAPEAAIPSLMVQEYTQTRKIRENVTRRIRVPTGAVSWLYSGGYAPAGSLDFDTGESAKVAANGSNTINDFMYIATGGGLTAPSAQPIGGSRIVQMTGNVTAPFSVTFNIRL